MPLTRGLSRLSATACMPQVRESIDTDMLDPEFAETVLAQLKTALALAKLKDLHGSILRRRLASLEGELVKAAISLDSAAKKEEPEGEPPASEWDAPAEARALSDDSDEDDAGGLSPVLEKDYAGDDAVDAEIDKAAMEEQRRSILEAEKDKLRGAAAKNASRCGAPQPASLTTCPKRWDCTHPFERLPPMKRRRSRVV